MYLSEQYYLYYFTDHLIRNENYKVFHFNIKKNEVWLMKKKWRETKIIRLIQKGFDWRNHLKNDIASIFKRVQSLQRHIGSRNIEIYNVYISDIEPVDDWQSLRQPLHLKSRYPLKMNVFYITPENRDREEEKLLNKIDAKTEFQYVQPTTNLENAILQYKYKLQQAIYNRNKQVQQVFSYGKPVVTYILLYINIIMFFFLELFGGSTNTETLVLFGAKFNLAIISGEWWRIITSMFLHVGFIHLIMNMLALYYLGTAVEKIFGTARFTIIYFLAGISGGITSFAFNQSIAAGASGSLFGLFGALLFFGTVYKDLFRQTMGNNLIIILIINLIFGFLVPQIDMGAHLGGLIGGYIASAFVFVPNKRKKLVQISAIITYLFLLILLSIYGYLINMEFYEQYLH